MPARCRKVGARVGHRIGDRLQDDFRLLGIALLDLHGAADQADRDRALLRRKAPFDMQRFPGAFFLVFGDAETQLPRLPLRRLVELVRPDPQRVHDYQPDRASHGDVRPVTRTEHIVRRIEPELPPDRSVDHHEDRLARRALQQAATAGQLVERLEGCQNDREVLGLAAGHHRVGRGQAHRTLAPEVFLLDDDLLGIAVDLSQELRDEFLGGRNDGQAIRPAALVAVLDRLAGVPHGLQRRFSRSLHAHAVPPRLLPRRPTDGGPRATPVRRVAALPPDSGY